MNAQLPPSLIERVDGIFMGQPVFEYALMNTSELAFSDKVRFICTNECDQYGKSWVCSEQMTPLDECIARCREFLYAVVFSTISEVEGAAVGFTEHLLARREHEDVTSAIEADFKREFGDILTLSTGCLLCEKCAYPEACRHPLEKRSTTESHGILIMQTVAERGMNFDCGENVVTYFSIILFNE